jgi:hypothetical protein
MAVSARIGNGLREDTTGTIVCNTCGGPGTLHLFRPTIGYRCAECVEVWGKSQTVTIEGTVRLSDGEGHVGVIDSHPG